MTFTIYYPPAAEHRKVPVLWYLSGLTCNDENFIQKSGAQRKASELGIALVAPDTSPRGLKVPGEDESWDFGVGAGFYLNATVPKWKSWRMYDYVVDELPSLLEASFGDKVKEVLDVFSRSCLQQLTSLLPKPCSWTQAGPRSWATRWVDMAP